MFARHLWSSLLTDGFVTAAVEPLSPKRRRRLFGASIGGERRVSAPPNKQLQRTVRDKVPRHMRQRAAAELRR